MRVFAEVAILFLVFGVLRMLGIVEAAHSRSTAPPGSVEAISIANTIKIADFNNGVVVAVLDVRFFRRASANVDVDRALLLFGCKFETGTCDTIMRGSGGGGGGV